ncbi:MAG TPA: hypothetical protein VLF68_00275 [Candidatus Saccharimonadales bacterium]|nr:hypothetical protein [Candidatus Saccharimonadales bacterium]
MRVIKINALIKAMQMFVAKMAQSVKVTLIVTIVPLVVMAEEIMETETAAQAPATEPYVMTVFAVNTGQSAVSSDIAAVATATMAFCVLSITVINPVAPSNKDNVRGMRRHFSALQLTTAQTMEIMETMEITVAAVEVLIAVSLQKFIHATLNHRDSVTSSAVSAFL